MSDFKQTVKVSKSAGIPWPLQKDTFVCHPHNSMETKSGENVDPCGTPQAEKKNHMPVSPN